MGFWPSAGRYFGPWFTWQNANSVKRFDTEAVLIFPMEWRSRLEEFGAMASQFQLSFPRRKRSASALDVYLVLVALAGLLVCGWLLRDASTSLGNADLTFWVLAACVLPAELMRVTTLNRGSVNTLTMSRPFALALLTGWGAPLTVVVFVIASVVSDLIYRKLALPALPILAAGRAAERAETLSRQYAEQLLHYRHLFVVADRFRRQADAGGGVNSMQLSAVALDLRASTSMLQGLLRSISSEAERRDLGWLQALAGNGVEHTDQLSGK